jgi:hypothetical protein
MGRVNSPMVLGPSAKPSAPSLRRPEKDGRAQSRKALKNLIPL